MSETRDSMQKEPVNPEASDEPADAADAEPEAQAVAPAEDQTGEEREAAPGDRIAELEEQLEAMQTAIQEHEDRFLRAKAEVENTRRRAEADIANARKFSIEQFAAEMLNVRDSLELAQAVELKESDNESLARMQEGLDLTLKQLDSVFAKFAIEVVDPKPGDKLDPQQHQALSMQESAEIEPNHVMAVIQKGYTLHERLLRPATVIVAKAREPQAEESLN